MFLFYLIYLRDFILILHYFFIFDSVICFGLFYHHRRSSATSSEKGGLVWSLKGKTQFTRNWIPSATKIGIRKLSVFRVFSLYWTWMETREIVLKCLGVFTLLDVDWNVFTLLDVGKETREIICKYLTTR